MTGKDEKKMWIELSDKESDWRDCFKVCVRSFHEDPFYCHTHPDPEKRRRFLEAYFDWLYDGIFKGGRGVLVVIKCQEEDGVKVIGGMGNTIEEDETVTSDDSRFRIIDEEGWNTHMKWGNFELDCYFPKLEAAAEKLGTNLMHGVFQNVDDGYRGQGIGSRFIMEAVEMMNDEVVRRKREQGIKDPKPPLAYCTCEHERSRNFTKKTGFIEVAEIPTHGSGFSDEKLSHIWVFLLPPKDPTWVDVVRREFGPLAKL